MNQGRSKRFWQVFRVQISLRTLLLILTLFCVWLGLHLRGASRQMQAVAKVREHGGEPRYGYQFVAGKFDPKAASRVPAWILSLFGEDIFHTVFEVNLSTQHHFDLAEIDPNAVATSLDFLPMFPHLNGLYLNQFKASDENLAFVGKLKNLKRLYLFDAISLTDAGVAHLGNLNRLTEIHVSSSRITDKSLAVFSGMPELEKLALQFNCFSDSGVRQLASLKRIRSLWLCAKKGETNNITDESVSFLLDLPRFSALGVQGSLVTKEFLDRLKTKFPKCTVAR